MQNTNFIKYTMILKTVLQEVIESQNLHFEKQQTGIERNKIRTFKKTESHVSIISGIRRCGKSTLMRQIIATKPQQPKIFINFEDSRFSAFDVDDFAKLKSILEENYPDAEYYFDEIQNINEWERFVRVLHDSGKSIYVTGSNASLLSVELGTKLTGRHLLTELFPFSYTEYLAYRQEIAGEQSFSKYLFTGGFPDYLKTGNTDILHQLYNDVVMRDIVVRYGLKDQRLLREFGIYLLSNVGKEFSYHSLRKIFSIGSTNTVSNYVSYFENSYLLFQIPKLTWSIKKQIINPKKIYGIDTGLIHTNSLSFSNDKGRLLENMVFLALRNAGKSIFYFKETNECDFVYKQYNKVEGAIQVCYQLTAENQKREINGLLEAIKQQNLSEGLILTLNEDDHFTIDGKEIIVKPVWKWIQSIIN